VLNHSDWTFYLRLWLQLIALRASPDARVDPSSRHNSRHADRSVTLADLQAMDQLTIGDARGSSRTSPSSDGPLHGLASVAASTLLPSNTAAGVHASPARSRRAVKIACGGRLGHIPLLLCQAAVALAGCRWRRAGGLVRRAW